MAHDEENTDDIEASIVEYFYERQVSGHKCGYCGSKDSFMSNGMWGHRLAGQDYQDLIDRGWRRSGKYMYKPVMSRTCCPLYAIRCEALNFKPSKSQKKVTKKIASFLVDGKGPRPRDQQASGPGRDETKDPLPEKKEEASKEEKGGSEDLPASDKESEQGKDVPQTEAAPETDATATLPEGPSGSEGSVRQQKKTPRPGVGADPNKPPCKKARQLRLERRKNKLAAKEKAAPANERAQGKSKSASAKKKKQKASSKREPSPTQPLHTTIEELLKLPSQKTMAHRLETKMVECYPPSQEFISTFLESYMLYKKYQMAVHGDKEEEISERSFRRFLCDTPLISLDGPRGWENKYGSFHYQYYLDGKLIMVAVMDILPTYLSSVYVYYDPDYRWLELGVYSALREIELVQKLNRSKPEFQYYCMGYYLHNHPKMEYKGRYHPSYLLCPETYRYVPIEDARQRIDEAKCSRLSDDQCDPERVLSFLGGVLILFEKQVIPYMLFRSYYGHTKDRIVVEYASLVGKSVTQRMFLYLTLDANKEQDEDSDD